MAAKLGTSAVQVRRQFARENGTALEYTGARARPTHRGAMSDGPCPASLRAQLLTAADVPVLVKAALQSPHLSKLEYAHGPRPCPPTPRPVAHAAAGAPPPKTHTHQSLREPP
jgi:hypothetical protein